MAFDLEVKLAVYRHFAASGARPSATQIAGGLDAPVASVREAFGRLRAQRVLVLEADDESIRMAPRSRACRRSMWLLPTGSPTSRIARGTRSASLPRCTSPQRCAPDASRSRVSAGAPRADGPTV